MAKLISSPDSERNYEAIDDDEGILFPKPKSADKRKDAPKEKDDLVELRNSNLAQFFGAGGPIAAQLPGYELRSSQLEMQRRAPQ